MHLEVSKTRMPWLVPEPWTTKHHGTQLARGTSRDFWEKKTDDLEKKRAEEAAKKAAEEARIKAEEEARKKIFVSWTRIGMGSAIFIFGIYNVHLGMSS